MPVKVVIKPHSKIVVHEIIEYAFNNWVNAILAGSELVGGTSSPVLFWCEGVAFQFATYPNSDLVLRDQLMGVVHYSTVTFALKEKFESKIRTERGTIVLLDQSINSNFVQLAMKLKKVSKLKNKF